MKRKLFGALGLSTLTVLALASCGGDNGSDALRLHLSYGDTKKTLTYNMSSPITMPDGTVVSSGDLKPMWQYVEEQLGIEIEDVAPQQEKAQEMITTNAATQFKDADIFGGNSIADQLMAQGADGMFIALDDHLDKMPNLKK